ncbi:G-protein coupled receptor 83-like [Oppia nitens]|uniref:G-protein coupled receptor 83-like n=1 Tax=Oppia nitens TaxID=1686743 RepID=UPI0023D9E654|nr:G-protein coupled receptor 83-like [Oppia nitens]
MGYYHYDGRNFTSLEGLFDYLNITPPAEPQTGNVMTVSAYSLIVFVSLLGNVLVCKVSLENPTTTNCLIASLAISDLLVTVFNIPLNVARLLLEEWPFGQFLCFFVPFIQVMAVYVSSFTMAVIAIHRWCSVTSRMAITSCSKRQLWITIVSTWTLSALMAIPLSMYNQTQPVFTYRWITRCRVVYPQTSYDLPLLLTLECFLTQYLIPLSLACIIYGKIAMVISRQGKIANLRGSIEAKRRQRHKRRRILMLVLVVAIFAICWLPLNIYHLLMDLHLAPHNYKIFIMCHWFAMSSVCYNPFIYCWLNKPFRKGAKLILSYLMCRCPPPVTDRLYNNNHTVEVDAITRQTLELNILTAITPVDNNDNNDNNNIVSF